MASTSRRSSSLTDVTILKAKFKDYGFTGEEKLKQRFMLTPFDLSECVGLQNRTYPKQPLGPCSAGSMFSSGCRPPCCDHDHDQRSLRKVKSATVLLQDQGLSGKNASSAKTQLPDACLNLQFHSTERLRKQKKQRISGPDSGPTASRSTTELRRKEKAKRTVVKRHLSSPDLGRNMPSDILEYKKVGDAENSSRSVTNTSSEDGVSGRNHQPLPIPPHIFSLKIENMPIVNNSFGSKQTEKWASGSLEVPVGNKKGDGVQPGGSVDSDHRDHQAVPTALLNHWIPVTSSSLLQQESFHDVIVSNEGELCGPKVPYHQSSILLLTCETDCSSDSGADTDKEERTISKLPYTETNTVKGQLMTKDSAVSKPELAIDRDSGIGLSRLTLVDNQSSLLITSHDTDCTSDGGCDAIDRGKEGLLEDQSDRSEKAKVVSPVQTDTNSEAIRCEMETGNGSQKISCTTQIETSLAKVEEQCLDTEAEFLRVACVFSAINLLPVGCSEVHVIHKEKAWRRKKRSKQQAIREVPDRFTTQRSTNKWVSETLDSSEEEETEPRRCRGTREGITEHENCKMENILLRGELERLKQTNSTLRSNTQSLLNKVENEAKKNELLNGKSYRLRTRVKFLKREMKGMKTKFRCEKISNETVVKLYSALKCEQNTKLKQLEEVAASQRTELQRIGELVSWQQAELWKANKLIEEQKVELRAADEEIVNQLEQSQCTFAVLQEQELALKEAKELSEIQRKQIVKSKEYITMVTQKEPKIEEKLLTERSSNSALREQVGILNNQPAQENHGLQQQTAELNKALELNYQQLSRENEHLKQELVTARPQSKRNNLAQVVQENSSHVQNTNFVKTIETPESENTELNSEKKKRTTQTFQESNLLAESTGLVVSDKPLEDHQEPSSATEQNRSEGFLSIEADSANVTANERNASRFLWLMSECSRMKEIVRKFELEHHNLVQRTDAEKELMRREVDRLIEEGLWKDKELDMLESSLEELGKVKNLEITGLKQMLRKHQESNARLKEELERKDEELRMTAVAKHKNKWFGGRQQ